jgi:hypothetical protein
LRQTACRHGMRCVCAAAFALASLSFCVQSQENRAAAPSDVSAPNASKDSGTGVSSADVRALSDTVSALQAEIHALNSQIDELRAAQSRSDAQVRALQEQLAQTEGRTSIPASVRAADAQNGYQTPAPQDLSATPMNSATGSSPAQTESIPDRVAQLEEGEELLNSKIIEQSQSKVESGSKYRVRLSGIVLLNVFANRGGVDNQDFPGFAEEVKEPFGSNSFGGSLRQSQIGAEVFGPTIGGARTSASVDFDFAGGFPEQTPNGQIMGLMRLRTAAARFDWTSTSIIAGQDRLFFAPLAPTSIASLAVPALSYAGNLWSWTPQVRVEHKVPLSDKSSFLVQGGILDSLSGDVPQNNGQDADPSWGEQSGLPALAARVAWTRSLFGQDLTLGTGGYYGRQYWGFGRHVDGWASTLDVSIPLSKMFSLTGAFYRGRAVAGLGGALDQDVVMSGSLFSPTTIIHGVDSMGGWMQLKFKPLPNFQIDGAYGEDNPYASQLDHYPNTFTYTGYLLTRNQSPMVNFIYQVRSDVEFSVEYRRLKTMVLNDDTETANHYTASLGYKF